MMAMMVMVMIVTKVGGDPGMEEIDHEMDTGGGMQGGGSKNNKEKA
jgi:hypothetical protein